MSYTKGPWKVGKWKDGQEVYIDAPNGEPDFGTSRWEGLAVVYGSDDEDFDTAHRKCEANAHLIATAPELLEALKSVAYVLKSGDRAIVDTVWAPGEVPCTLLDLCELVIAKAEGQ